MGAFVAQVAQYRQFAGDCRRLAELLTKPADKQALELFAVGRDKIADDREAMLHSEEPSPHFAEAE